MMQLRVLTPLYARRCREGRRRLRFPFALDSSDGARLFMLPLTVVAAVAARTVVAAVAAMVAVAA
jgi:hypothetical protein